MIELDHLTNSYVKHGIPALYDIVGRIEPGIHLLAGENGAGKTTLLHLIAGVATPLSGYVRISGQNPADDSVIAKGKTFLLEDNTEIPMKTIRGFAHAHSPFYPNFSSVRFDENLRAFRLTGDEPAKALSLGTRKKSLLAYALALGVETLLLDEPTNALDIQSKEVLKSLVAKNIFEEQTVIVSTQTVSELENLFDGALMMKQGRLLWNGSEQDAAERLSFSKTRTYHPDSIYAEAQLGYYKAILPATDEKTNVDWRLLYSALHSPKCNDILLQLNRSK